MPGEAAAAAAIAKLLTAMLGYMVDPKGFAQWHRDTQLDMLMRGINAAIKKEDWATVDALFAHYRELRQQTE